MSKMSEVKVCLCPPFPRSWVDEAFCSKMLHPHCRSALAWCHGCGSPERGVHPCGDGYWNTVMESGSPARVVSTEYRAIAGGHG